MGAIKIECYLSESQMRIILNTVSRHLSNSDRSEICDFDDTIEGVRVCAEFNCFLGDVAIISAEILDSNYDVLHEDSAVFLSRLKMVVNDYNIDCRESYEQSLAIRQDQW